MTSGSQRRPDALSKGTWTVCAEAKRLWKSPPSAPNWWVWPLTAVLLNLALVCEAAAPPAIEYRVKAVALLNFTKFTQWPAASFSTPKCSFIVGIYGEDPFGAALREAISGETVNGHTLEIREITDDNALLDCHLVFIARSEAGKLRSLHRILAGKPVLTVSEIDGFRDSGGMIQFVHQDNRVRFDINRTSATEAGLTFSSRLLGVARTVTGK